MKRSMSVAAWVTIALLVVCSAVAAPREDFVRVELSEKQIASGVREVVVSVYETREGGRAIASERRSVRVDSGSFRMPLGTLSAVAGPGERWLGVRVPPGEESRRVLLTAATAARPVTINVVTDAAITANGFIESIAQGFRFPDGTIQTTAATGSGGVTNVNGATGAVTIVGAGTTNVGTAAGTITVTGPSFGTPVSVGSANAAGAATTIARSDHVHAHGNQAGGALHANASTSTAGFMSGADKTKLDAIVAYVRTVIVSPVAGDPVASGTALTNALNGISGNGASNPFLVKIEPGVYDVGATGVTMKTYVDIEGSGENATFIVASRGAASVGTLAAAVTGAVNAELRQLTVTNTAPGSTIGIGFFATSSATTRVRAVTINSTGAVGTSYGLYGNGSSTITAIRSTVTATGVGGTSNASGFHASTGTKFFIMSCSVTGKGVGGTGTNTGGALGSTSADAIVDDSTILATGGGGQNIGIAVNTGEAIVTGTTVQADTAGSRIAVSTSASVNSVLNVFHSRLLALASSPNPAELSIAAGTNSKVHVATSQVDSASTGTTKCVHVYDGDMDDMNNTCPGPIA